MELFKKSKTVRLKSHHGKFLCADDDESTVSQTRDTSKPNVLWTVELDPYDPTILQLKSCFGNYLTATNVPFLLGMTGKKVLQLKLIDPDSAVTWVPIKEDFSVKLKSRSGSYLRANTKVPPWRNSVTHDVPHRSVTHNWILWEVEPMENDFKDSKLPQKSEVANKDSLSSDLPALSTEDSLSLLKLPLSAEDSQKSSLSAKDSLLQKTSFSINALFSNKPSAIQSPSSQESSPTLALKLDGRTIYYAVADDDCEVPDEFDSQIHYQGHDLDMLIKLLKTETGIEDDIYVCAKNHINNKLFPLLLRLPPNNAPMYVVVVKASSKLAKTLPGISIESK